MIVRVRRAVRAALVVGALVLGSCAVARTTRAYIAERESLRPYSHRVVQPQGPFGLRLHRVTFAARDGRRVQGWYVPSRSGAAVVLCHGSGGDRTELLDEARALADAGVGVLLYDAPGHGETGGLPTYGTPEREALGGALDFLDTRPEVDSTRIGAFGFSMGGYTVAQVAASAHRVRAVALAGTPDDVIDQTRAEYARGGPLAFVGARLAQIAAGLDVRSAQPITLVAAIAPRPLLVVSGARDATVPPAIAVRLYAAARAPKYWISADGAGHGRYGRADPRYAPRLVAFFTEALARPHTTP